MVLQVGYTNMLQQRLLGHLLSNMNIVHSIFLHADHPSLSF
jgi:hypothetical protein